MPDPNDYWYPDESDDLLFYMEQEQLAEQEAEADDDEPTDFEPYGFVDMPPPF